MLVRCPVGEAEHAFAARPHVNLGCVTEPVADLVWLGHHAPDSLHWRLDHDLALDHLADRSVCLLVDAQPMVAFCRLYHRQIAMRNLRLHIRFAWPVPAPTALILAA